MSNMILQYDEKGIEKSPVRLTSTAQHIIPHVNTSVESYRS